MNLCFVDERLSMECERALRGEGFSVVRIPPLAKVAPAVASHTDISCFKYNNRIIIPESRKEQFYAAIEDGCGTEILPCGTEPRSPYPFDTPYNALVIGNRLFARLEGLCPEIGEYATECGLVLTNVNQGYAACTVLPVGDRAAITADKGMYKVLSECGIDVLEIQDDAAIKLPPYSNGFIGGAAAPFGHKIFFFGNLSALCDAARIRDFIVAHGYTPISLNESADSLFDLGGAIFT